MASLETKNFQMINRAGEEEYLVIHPETTDDNVLVTAVGIQGDNLKAALEEIKDKIADALAGREYTFTAEDSRWEGPADGKYTLTISGIEGETPLIIYNTSGYQVFTTLVFNGSDIEIVAGEKFGGKVITQATLTHEQSARLDSLASYLTEEQIIALGNLSKEKIELLNTLTQEQVSELVSLTDTLTAEQLTALAKVADDEAVKSILSQNAKITKLLQLVDEFEITNGGVQFSRQLAAPSFNAK